MQALSSTLAALEIGAPIASGPLTVFPLLRAGALAAAYALLDEALDAGLAEVTEISDGGSVPELLFRGKSDCDILLVDGEELVGAKQNRVFNLTILVGAFQEVKIPVSCVEAGGWAWRSRRFASGKPKLNASARFAKIRSDERSAVGGWQRATAGASGCFIPSPHGGLSQSAGTTTTAHPGKA